MKYPHIVSTLLCLASIVSVEGANAKGKFVLDVDVDINMWLIEHKLSVADSPSVYCSLYDDEERFLEQPLQQVIASREVNEIWCRFNIQSAGEYAVSLFIDVNGDGELDTNFIGMPNEPVGISNNPVSMFGPPSYEDSIITIEGNHRLTIKVNEL